MAADIHQHNSAYLKEEFLRDAKVLDPQRGYISVSSFNLRMKPKILDLAAQLIAEEFKDTDVNTIHGIPHSGNYLATAVALKLEDRVRLHSSRKDQTIPATWKDVYRQEIQSFTTSDDSITVYSGINLSFVQKGDRILLLDDVCATGETGYQIASGLLARGANVVGYAVLFDKIFQGGLAYIETLGIKTFSCIRVAKIGAHDQIVLQQK